MYMGIIPYLRQFRIGGYAVFDFTVSFLAAYLLAPWLSKLFRKIGLDIPKYSWLYFTVPISIIVHLIVNIITPLTRAFINPNGDYIIKIIILVLVVLGAKDIKLIKKQ